MRGKIQHRGRAGALVASCLAEASDLVSAARNLAREPPQLAALLDGARDSQGLALETLVQLRAAIGRAVRTEEAGRRYAALAERLRRGQRQGSAQAGP